MWTEAGTCLIKESDWKLRVEFIHRMRRKQVAFVGVVMLYQGLKKRPVNGECPVKNRFCPVKSLDGRTFSPLFYASNVIQTFTFLNTIAQDWTLLTFVKEKKWVEKEATRSRTFRV